MAGLDGQMPQQPSVNEGPVGEENTRVPRHPGVIGGRVGHQRDSFKQNMQKQALEHFLTMLRNANTIEQQNQILDIIKSNPALTSTLIRQQQVI